MHRRTIPFFFVLLIATWVISQSQSFGTPAILVQQLSLKCDDKRTIEATFYWNPDHVRLRVGKKILLLPKATSTNGFRYRNAEASFFKQKDLVIFSEKTIDTTCRIKRR